VNELDIPATATKPRVTYAEVKDQLTTFDALCDDQWLAERWAFYEKAAHTTPAPPTPADAVQAFTALRDIDPKRNKNTRKRSDSETRRKVRFTTDDPRDPVPTTKNNTQVYCMNCGSEAHASRNCPQPQKTCNHCLKVSHIEKSTASP
jgi:hypothetical protein